MVDLNVLEEISKDLFEVFNDRDDGSDPPDVLAKKRHLLDDPDFDVSKYVAERFSDESSLNHLPLVLESLDKEIDQLSCEIVRTLHEQQERRQQARNLSLEIRSKFTELQELILNIKEKAKITDSEALEVANEIKLLYEGKESISNILQVLQTLSVLVDATRKLHEYLDAHDLSAAAAMISVVMELRHSDRLKKLPGVTGLLEQTDFALREVKTVALEEFDSLFDPDTPTIGNVLSACEVVDAMGGTLRHEVITTFIKTILKSYTDAFGPGGPHADLEDIKRRSAWLKKAILELETTMIGSHFPPSWNVKFHLAIEWCHVTNTHMLDIFSEKHFDMKSETFKLTLRHLGDTEKNLKKLFDDERTTSNNNFDPTQFIGLLTDTINPFINTWVASEEQTLRSKISVLQSNPAIYTNKESVSFSGNDVDAVYTSAYREPVLTYEFAADIFTIIHKSFEIISLISNRYPLCKMIRVYESLLLRHLEHLKNERITSNEDKQTTLAVTIGTLDFYEQNLSDFESDIVSVLDKNYLLDINFNRLNEKIWVFKKELVNEVIKILIKPIEKVVKNTLERLLKRENGKDVNHQQRAHLKEVLDHGIASLPRLFNEPLILHIIEQMIVYSHKIVESNIKEHTKKFGVTEADCSAFMSLWGLFTNTIKESTTKHMGINNNEVDKWTNGRSAQLRKLF